jgi:aryl-alcohol dehydrogenase-like predicted oxidoreductase
MKYTTLPNTDIKISKICLGTMTLDNKIRRQKAMLKWIMRVAGHFFWCIIRYQPMKNLRSTEKIIGTWLKTNQKRRVLASKIAGPNPNFAYMRDTIDFSPKSIQY